MDEASLSRRLAAEALGTLVLVATVVGSGIMAERLAGGNAAVALIGNTLATGAILVLFRSNSASGIGTRNRLTMPGSIIILIIFLKGS